MIIYRFGDRFSFPEYPCNQNCKTCEHHICIPEVAREHIKKKYDCDPDNSFENIMIKIMICSLFLMTFGLIIILFLKLLGVIR